MRHSFLGQVTSTTLYTPVVQFPASAGVAVFNVSLSKSNVVLPSSLDLQLLTTVPNLFSNSLRTYGVNPSSNVCSGSSCSSYFFVGGLDVIFPSPFLLARPQGVDTVGVRGEQSLQGEYWNVSPSEAPMTTQDCQTWGSNAQEAFMLCIKSSSVYETSLIAGETYLPML